MTLDSTFVSVLDYLGVFVFALSGAWLAIRRDLDLVGVVTLGLVTVFIQHTSASLVIQENADPAVLEDLISWFGRVAPEGSRHYTHTAEGPDDMPAHVRSALTSTTLSTPVIGGRPALGTWQGIYLYEHRDAPHRRRIAAHLIGD